MTPLEALAWRSGRGWCAWHLAPEGTDTTLCGLTAVKSGPWTISREPFGSFAMDPTSCLNCLEAWLRNRGKELKAKSCECPNPKNVSREADGVFCEECHSWVTG